jgi:thiol-disulfide isomerase/thioredoxin
LVLVAGVAPAPAGFSVAHAQSGSKPWLGVELATGKDPAAGVLVRHVMRTSPSEKAGIKDNDLIVSVNGKTASSPRDVITEVRAHAPGDALAVVLTRGGREIRMTVTLSPAPAADEMLRRDKVGTFSPPINGLASVQGSVPGSIGGLRGKVVVLDFWASWCGVCKMMTPTLNEWHKKYAAQGLVVLGVSSDKHDVATSATKKFGIDYAVGADTHDKVFPGFNVPALPTMYVLDKGGVVREVEVGFDPAHLQKTEEMIKKLLADKTP